MTDSNCVAITAVIPAFNEQKTIARIVEGTRKHVDEVIVVDDSSSDGTLEVAKRIADLAIGKPREGQTKGLLYGAKIAKYPVDRRFRPLVQISRGSSDNRSDCAGN